MKGDRKPAVLVVEDEQDNSDLLIRALRNLVDIEVCADGAVAVERVRDGHFLAVIADQVLPGLTGVELLEKVARLAPQTERILISGYPSTQVLTDAINRGNVGHFLPKPIDVQELVKLVRRLIAHSAPAPSNRALVIAGPDELATIEITLASLGIAYDVVATIAGAAKLRPPSGWELCVWDTATVPSALAALPAIATAAPGAALVCIERAGGSPDAPRLLDAGADDVIWRPLRGEELAVRVRRVLDRRRLLVEAARLRRSGVMHGLRELVGTSSAMRDIYTTIERLAASDVTVLIRGETGTGKELVARVVHAMSSRRERPFVTVNCAALPETLVESELFGHERGAFTGATAQRLGRFERAHGGTLFIDEVGDIPLPVQVKLLRALQERAFERVGGNDTQHVDIRLIAATNRDLERSISAGTFREDLFYRLNVVPLRVPPLRERVDDIWPLARHFLAEYQRRMGKDGIRISERMHHALETYAWAGNVRELMNVIERAVALTQSGGVADLVEMHGAVPPRVPQLAAGPPGARKLKDLVGEYEGKLVDDALARHGGNIARAAKELGMSRQALAQKLAKRA